MFSPGDYIVLIGLVYISLTCGHGISDAREESKSVNIMIACELFAVFVGTMIIPEMSAAFINGNRFNRIVFCIYLGANFFVHLRFMKKKTGGSICTGKCRILMDAWICSISVYTILFGYCLFDMNYKITILAAGVFAVCHCCILGFDYYFEEEPFKEWEKVKHELLPLREISAGQYREWSKRRELKLRKRTLLFAALYQGVFIILLLAAAKRITLAAVLIIALLYCLTLGSLAFSWSKRLKDVESRTLESVYRGQAFIETASPFRVRYMDSEEEFQSRVVEKVQRKKYKQGTLVDIVMENGEVVLAERNLPE